jgi:hypothetical protein
VQGSGARVRDESIRCEDCGTVYDCRWCNQYRPFAGKNWNPQPCQPGEHETAARVKGWTVWFEHGGLNRQTILCPKHRKQRGIPARAIPLEDAS